ncbi:MAG: DUF1249 domain-containing protein [Gammaproteobacteria bacterium]|nr:DUF1249 domain-containing protein [Gammaproteobacteria bacterium]MDH4254716.1 DUF1249 domain-containing protein [Gammaproteobacteria bacterium]MDH5308706.1 DUF1249 domain-containing protein [Gammaproteobacteria bacterium]
MLFDHELVPQTIARPGSFTGLMSVYESNFLRLMQVVPELERLDGYYQSKTAADCTLHLEVLDRSRYTITVSLSYFFYEDGRRIADPDMRIRVYLDGQLAEAMSFNGDHRHAELRRLWREHRRELGARWRRNVVLNKWLDYLRDQGHLILER